MLIKIIKQDTRGGAGSGALIEATPPIRSEAKPAPKSFKIAPSPKPGPVFLMTIGRSQTRWPSSG